MSLLCRLLLFLLLCYCSASLVCAQDAGGGEGEGLSQKTCLLLYLAKPGGGISGPKPPWRRPVYQQSLPFGGAGDVVAAVPHEGFRFVQWSDGSKQNPRRDVNITKDMKIEAEFAVFTPVPTAGLPGFDYGWEQQSTLEIGYRDKTETKYREIIIDSTTRGKDDWDFGSGVATRELVGATGPKSLQTPVIDETEKDDEEKTVTLEGWWFGPVPRVWREYTVPGEVEGTTKVVRQYLTVLPPDETYQDFEGRNTYQDPTTGESKLSVIMPDKHPEGGVPKGKIYVDNGVGRGSDKDPTVEEESD